MAEESLLGLSGGINQDDSIYAPAKGEEGVSAFQSGDYRYAQNMRIGSSVEDNQGAGENVTSTLELSGYSVFNGSAFVSGSPPSGTFRVVGKYEDEINRMVYSLVYNSGGNHVLYRFAKGDTVRTELLRWSGLNLGINNLVSMWKIGDYLFFTCNQAGDDGSINPPRMVKVPISVSDPESVWNLKSTLASSFGEFHISLAKWAPLAPPIIKANSSTPTVSDLSTGIFQFSYRYVFYGGFRSTFSPFSSFVSNYFNGGVDRSFTISIPGFIFKYNDRNNTSFQHSSIAFYAFVELIEIIYRESSTDRWKIFLRHEVGASPINNQTFTFTNNGPSGILPSQDVNRHFFSVPFYSGAGEGIDGRSMLTNNTDELEVPDFEIENPNVISTPPNTEWTGATTLDYTSLTSQQVGDLSSRLSIKKFSFKEGGVYKLGIVFQHWNGRESLAISKDNMTFYIPRQASTIAQLNYSERANALEFNIPMSIIPPDWAVGYRFVRTNCLNFDFFIQGEINEITYLGYDAQSLNDTIETPDDVKAVMNEFANNSKNGAVSLELSYRILNILRKNKEVATLNEADFLYIDISNWMLTSKGDATATTSHPSNSLYYNFQRGDKVRIQGVGPTFEETIVNYTGKGIIIAKPSTLTIWPKRSSGISGSKLKQIEIFRERSFNEDDSFFFSDMGEWYPIKEPGTANRDFSKRDFRWTSMAAVTGTEVNGHTIFNKMPIVNGDVWIVAKYFYYNYVSASQNGISPSLFWMQMNVDFKNASGIWERNNGRRTVSYDSIPKLFNKPTQVRFSGQYIQDSIYNSLNAYFAENQFVYPQEYGAFRGLKATSNAEVTSVGTILMAFGERQVISIYVNRTTLEDLSGRTQVSLTDRVLGSYNTLLGSFGCLNPESISARNSKVVWWSQPRGCWVRYSRDGCTDISDRKLKNWFNDLADLISPSYAGVPAKAISVFDNYHEDWLTSFEYSSLPATFKGYSVYKSASFSEMDGRWKSFWEYAADQFTHIDDDVYSLVGIRVYSHERGADFGSFYGVKKDSYIQYICNDQERITKYWKNLAVLASDQWSGEDIVGDWKSNSATRQQTRIPLTSFEDKEGIYWAAIPMDKNTPNASSETAGVADGNFMRSRALTFLMKLDPSVTHYSVINWLAAYWDRSQKSLQK